jgi:hypothetical protein
MIGSRWSSVVTVSMKTVNVDLCSEETLGPDASSLFGSQSIENQNGSALFFDPYEKTDDLRCEYAQMAQAAEKSYFLAAW